MSASGTTGLDAALSDLRKNQVVILRQYTECCQQDVVEGCARVSDAKSFRQGLEDLVEDFAVAEIRNKDIQDSQC